MKRIYKNEYSGRKKVGTSERGKIDSVCVCVNVKKRGLLRDKQKKWFKIRMHMEGPD